MVAEAEAPDRGDLVWISLDPQAGHERAGRRPAMVLSPAGYNSKTGLALCCPATSRVKGYPFEVTLPHGGSIQGVVLADQVKSLDWKVRRAEIADTAPNDVVEEVLAKLGALFV